MGCACWRVVLSDWTGVESLQQQHCHRGALVTGQLGLHALHGLAQTGRGFAVAGVHRFRLLNLKGVDAVDRLATGQIKLLRGTHDLLGEALTATAAVACPGIDEAETRLDQVIRVVHVNAFNVDLAVLISDDGEMAVIEHLDVKWPWGVVNCGLVTHARAAALFHPEAEEAVLFRGELEKLGVGRLSYCQLLDF